MKGFEKLIKMKNPFLIGVFWCLFSAKINKVASLEDLSSAGTTFILNGAVESGTGVNSGSKSGSSSGVRRFRGAGFDNVARFRYPTKFRVGTETLNDDIGFKDFDDLDEENFNTGISYLPESGNKIHDRLSSILENDAHLVDKDSSKSNHEASTVEASKGYKVTEDFDKAKKNQLEKSQHADHHDSNSGSKKENLDELKKYSKTEAAVKGEKGETFENSQGHKKGHKTSGYHNVYHKDEYKKDTTFYDDEHASAHEEAFGTEGIQHAKVKGSHEKVEKVNSEFHEDEEGKRGFFTNGHQYGVTQGHDRERYEKAEEEQKIEEEVSESSHRGL